MKFFEHQLEHLISLIVLVFAVYWASRAEGVLSGSLYGLHSYRSPSLRLDNLARRIALFGNHAHLR